MSRGITHIESLPHKKFISYVKNISDFIASEKLDGNNFTFGFDTNGVFYTSRESKGGIRFFNSNDYSDIAANNGNRSAHIALEKMQSFLKCIMNNGDACEVELLYGRQPNAIVYGLNYVAFLRMIVGDNKENPDQSKIKKLGDLLKYKSVDIEVPVVTTNDGINIVKRTEEQSWYFASVSYISSYHFEKVDVDKEISEIEIWLKEKHSTGYSNGDLMEIKLPGVPKEIRAEVKKAREETLEATQKLFILPIKEKFLNEVIRRIKPALRDSDVNSNEDIGIEGVVFLHPETQEQFKIVDKAVFTVINQFNFAVRNQLKSGSKGRRIAGNASVGIEGDIFNNMIDDIGNVIGMPQMNHISSIKRIFNKYKGDTQEETLNNFITDLTIIDVIYLKIRINDIILNGLKSVDDSLKMYKVSWNDYKLELKTGKSIRYTDEIHNRTLMVFAEIKKEMQELMNIVKNSITINDIVIALYGKKLKEIH